MLVFLDKNGEELDRVVGYRNVDDFLIILNNILNNENTFMSLFKKYNKGDSTVDLIDKLSLKSEDRQDHALTAELYNIVFDRRSEFQTSTIERGEYYFSKESLKNDDPSKIKKFISKYDKSEQLGPAYMDLIRFYASKKDTIKEVETYKKMINVFMVSDLISISRKSSFLNSYAWRMSELEINLDDALLKSVRSIEILDSLGETNSSRKAMLLDTQAEILWKMDKFNEAIDIINQAIKIDSENEYYRDQKIKFQSSKEEI